MADEFLSATVRRTTQTTYRCFIDDKGNIYAKDGVNDECIGATRERFQELMDELMEEKKLSEKALSKAEEYQEILIEHGLIEKELTVEEKLANTEKQLEDTNKKLDQVLSLLSSQHKEETISEAELEELTKPDTSEVSENE